MPQQLAGIAHAAAGVGAERHREQAGGDARARARRRAAGMMIGVPRIARRRPRQVEARPADGELVRRELAEHDRAGAAQLRDARPRRRSRRCPRRILEWQVVGRPATSMMSLMPTGTPCSGPRSRPAVDLGLGGLRRLQRGLGVEPDEGVELRIEPLDALEQRLQSARPARARGRRSPARPRRRCSQCSSLTAPAPRAHRRPRFGRGSVGA